ncbi:MAG TPA: hypothetical protein VF221_09770 [Chloroflexota bacterium]
MSIRYRFTIAGVVCLFLAMPLGPVGVRAKGEDSLSARLFMLEPKYQRTLMQLDGNSLASIGGVPLGNVSASLYVKPRDVVPSPDGSHIAVVTYGRTPIYARYITIRIFDSAGVQRARFHPQVPITLSAVSDDGKWIEGARTWPQTAQLQTRPATLEVLDGTHGRILNTLVLPADSGAGLLDIRGGRLYTADVAQPFVLTSYDLLRGKVTSRLSLDNIVVPWTGPKQMSGLPVVHISGIAMALSPDGKQIAIYNGESNQLTMIDAPSLKVLSTRSVSQPRSWLERLGSALGLAPATAEAKEIVFGMSLSMTFSADGQSLYVTGSKSALDVTGHPTWTNIGVERIDVASGQLVAEQPLGGMPIWWIGMAADSSAVYVLTPLAQSDDGYAYQDGQVALRRLDGSSLQMTAERTLDATSQPRLYILG